MWGDHQISDIRCIAHTVQRRCLTVYRPPPPLYGCTGHRRPPRVDRDPATAAANTTQLQRHSVGNRSWARPLVLSLQLQTPWSVIIGRHRPRAYREEDSLPGNREQRDGGSVTRGGAETMPGSGVILTLPDTTTHPGHFKPTSARSAPAGTEEPAAAPPLAELCDDAMVNGQPIIGSKGGTKMSVGEVNFWLCVCVQFLIR